MISVKLKTNSGNLRRTGSIERKRLSGVRWEAYRIANLCAQFTETVSIPTRCTGGRWRYCSRSRDRWQHATKSKRGNPGRLNTSAHLEAQCEICSLNPRVVHSGWSGHRLARSASIKCDDIVRTAEPRIVHLTP